MLNEGDIKEVRYRLCSFVVEESPSRIRVVQYLYLMNTGNFREISYFGEIDTYRNLLMITSACMIGKKVDKSEDEIELMLQSLPLWNKTRYYQFCGYNSDIYLCSSSIPSLGIGEVK